MICYFRHGTKALHGIDLDRLCLLPSDETAVETGAGREVRRGLFLNPEPSSPNAYRERGVSAGGVSGFTPAPLSRSSCQVVGKQSPCSGGNLST